MKAFLVQPLCSFARSVSEGLPVCMVSDAWHSIPPNLQGGFDCKTSSTWFLDDQVFKADQLTACFAL